MQTSLCKVGWGGFGINVVLAYYATVIDRTERDALSVVGLSLSIICHSRPHLGYPSCSSALNSGPGYGGVGKPFNSGHGATARDFSAEGANDAWYGLHLDIPKKDLAAKLRLLVQPDGSLKDAPLCDTGVNPDHPGLTKRRSTFGLDREGALIMGVCTTATVPTGALEGEPSL